MKRPTTEKSNPTKEELREYAQWRKQDEIKNIDGVLKEVEKEKIESVEDSENYRQPLSVAEFRLFKIQVSWGGDGDGFIIEVKEGEVISGKYYWEDWGVHEEVRLTDEEAQKVADYYGIYIE